MDKDELTSPSTTTTTTDYVTDDEQTDDTLAYRRWYPERNLPEAVYSRFLEAPQSIAARRTITPEQLRTRAGITLTDEEYERWTQRSRRRSSDVWSGRMASGSQNSELILSQQEAEEWKERHLKGYDTRLWSLELNEEKRSPEEDRSGSRLSLDAETLEEGHRSVTPLTYHTPSITERSESQSDVLTMQQLLLEKEHLERLIKIRSYELSRYRSCDAVDSLPTKEELQTEKRHLLRLKTEREALIKKRAHEEWRRRNVKPKLDGNTIREVHQVDNQQAETSRTETPSDCGKSRESGEISRNADTANLENESANSGDESAREGEKEFNKIFPRSRGMIFTPRYAEYSDDDIRAGDDRGPLSDPDEEEDEIIYVLVRCP